MNAFQGIALAIALAGLAVRVAGRQHRLLHLFQLEHYEPARLLLWLRRRGELVKAGELAGLAGLLGAAAGTAVAGLHLACGVILLAAAPVAVVGVRQWRRPAVKPLAFTARAKRLLALALVPSLAAVAVAVFLVADSPGEPHTTGLWVLLAIGWLALALSPYVLLGANLALGPVQAAVNRRYVRAARRTLADVGPLVVGVTGSYGKTTTKVCIGSVLGAERSTFITPASFNSLLGVVRAVNEGLSAKDEAFVVEMGMYRRGDIAELCELVHPKIGVITAIGPMHLERLGSIEAIAAAKAELMEALPSDGHLVTNGDDPLCLQIAERSHVPVTLFAIDNEDAQVRAGNVSFSGGRTELELSFQGGSAGAQAVRVSAGLLGRHNVANMAAAAAVGWVVGTPPAKIAAALGRVRAPEHRLSAIHNRAAGVLVIDDAYNSNPDGAAAALEVLAAHDAGRRVLVTPGMVELGEMEVELNRRFGEQAAAVCDLVVLVGPRRTAPVREGLIAGGMSADGVEVVADIGEATGLLAKLSRPGDVILFENDLPDTYQETGEEP